MIFADIELDSPTPARGGSVSAADTIAASAKQLPKIRGGPRSSSPVHPTARTQKKLHEL
jgi:hypothetical protein